MLGYSTLVSLHFNSSTFSVTMFNVNGNLMEGQTLTIRIVIIEREKKLLQQFRFRLRLNFAAVNAKLPNVELHLDFYPRW